MDEYFVSAVPIMEGAGALQPQFLMQFLNDAATKRWELDKTFVAGNLVYLIFRNKGNASPID